MKTILIGASGIEATALGLGTWAIGGGQSWGDSDDALSIRTIHQAVDMGITWVDTAPVYGFGHSEEVVGQALKGRRDKVILSTKCGLQWYDQGGTYHLTRDGLNIHRDLTPRAIRRDLEKSLQRLQTDYVDVYYTHRQSADLNAIPIGPAMETLLELKKEGLIRAIGVSNVEPSHIEEYQKFGPLDAVQQKYSIVDRAAEEGILPLCRQTGVTYQAYSPLEQGLLTGKFGVDYPLSAQDVRTHHGWWEPDVRRIVLEMLAGWQDLTEKYDCSTGNLVIAWTLAQNMAALIGARKLHHLEENVKAAQIVLDAADAARMTADSDAARQKIAAVKKH